MKEKYQYSDRVAREVEEDFYDSSEIEILLEDDEISADEEAFMQGYLGEED